jgi:hypothetical protein
VLERLLVSRLLHCSGGAMPGQIGEHREPNSRRRA